MKLGVVTTFPPNRWNVYAQTNVHNYVLCTCAQT